jgi:ribokinase
MRVAVVGHVEWIDFVAVERVPAPGEIVTARESWGEAAGGGAVAVVQLARLAGGATFFTALGDDDFGRRAEAHLAELGVTLEIDWQEAPQRRGFTYLDAEGERTITLLGEKLRPRGAVQLPWGDLAAADAVYFTGGDADALRAARSARVLVATSRELATLREARVELDALVGSASDAAENYGEGDLDPPPRLVVRTKGSDGGRYEPGGGKWDASHLPAEYSDSYGAGDSFAAGLTYALGRGLGANDAVQLAARVSAEALTRRGAHGVR